MWAQIKKNDDKNLCTKYIEIPLRKLTIVLQPKKHGYCS